MTGLEADLPTSLAVPADLAARVADPEVARLLGYPDRAIPDGPARAAVERARDRFDRHARPWALARSVRIVEVHGTGIRLADGTRLGSRALAGRLAKADADELIVAMVSAGRETDELSSAEWRQDRVDDAYFLDRFNAAAVEHLASWAAEELRAALARDGRAPLASYSPGYTGWDLEQMATVGRCLTGRGASTQWSFEILASGMIRPVSSMLAVFGVTRDLEAAAESWRRSGCAWCSLKRCEFRHALP